MAEQSTMPTTRNSARYGIEMQPEELNCGSEQIPNYFFNPSWDNSVDQSDPFESALSSMVSSPAASTATATATAGGIPTSGDGNTIVLSELIGKLGSISNIGDISSSCYSTPLNFPPKLSCLSMADPQIRGNLLIPGHNLPTHPISTPFSADPGFAARAARFSCFGSRNLGGSVQFGLNGNEFPQRLTPELKPINQSAKLCGSPVGGVQESKERSFQDQISAPDKKLNRFSRSLTPENAEFADSREGSSVSDQIPGGENGMRAQANVNGRKRKSVPKGKAKDNPSSAPSRDAKVGAESDEPNAKRSKADEANGKEKDAKPEAADEKEKQNKDNAKPPEPTKDFIHVRARRGQATDSHSLAERVRREKISERMKFLQDLVPGCNKVTGKAVMLDEIINYVQSLQRQVEFLSMKLATVNPRMDFNLEAFLSKDTFQSRVSMTQNLYALDSALPPFVYGYQYSQGLPLNSSIANGTGITPFSMDSLNAAMQLPLVEGPGDHASQASTFWGDDLHTVVQMGFGQNQIQNSQGTMATTQMKIEL